MRPRAARMAIQEPQITTSEQPDGDRPPAPQRPPAVGATAEDHRGDAGSGDRATAAPAPGPAGHETARTVRAARATVPATGRPAAAAAGRSPVEAGDGTEIRPWRRPGRTVRLDVDKLR